MDITPRHEFDDCLERAIEAAPGAREGLFGPHAAFWKLHREGVVILGGGCAALLQAAHPYVAEAIVEHSIALDDARRRFQRTFVNVFALVFGDLEHASRASRRVRDVHEVVNGRLSEDVGRFGKGDPYDANSRSAQAWVAATLLHTAVQVFEMAVGPISPHDKDRLIAEHQVFCAAFGIDKKHLPGNWAEFAAYWDDMVSSDTLAVGTAAKRIADSILRPPTLGTVMFYRWMHAFTGGLLPARFREAFGLPWGRAERAMFAATGPVMRAGVRAAPAHLRFFPAYLDARRRLRGLETPDRIGQWASRIFLATALPRPSRFASVARHLTAYAPT